MTYFTSCFAALRVSARVVELWPSLDLEAAVDISDHDGEDLSILDLKNSMAHLKSFKMALYRFSTLAYTQLPKILELFIA